MIERASIHRARATGFLRLLVTLLDWKAGALCVALHAVGALAAEQPVVPTSPADIASLSIDELANIEISSVSKKLEPLSEAAASIYVITRDDIRRYGATSIPEILRLAPNLQIARVSAHQHAITARGFNSNTPNKLLVLIDGRSVYAPLFSAVLWDAQDTLIEDIDRIEVISGPGGTLWGSNAVNGVINIITRNSKDTAGGLAAIGGGPQESGAALRYGARLGENGSYRVYGKGFGRENTELGTGKSARDTWGKGQAGFRMDWARSGDSLMLEGEGYHGDIDQRTLGDITISGAHLLGRWNRSLGDRSGLQVQTYYDLGVRDHPRVFGQVLNTWDIDAQHRFPLGAAHDLVWGGGYRMMHDAIDNQPAFAFLPATRTLHLANLFVQDTVSLAEGLDLTLGVKGEYNVYTKFEVQPSARLGWKLHDQGLLWTAVSRAVRTPSRFDRDLFAPGTPPFLLAGGPDFESETLTAFEAGYRAQPAPHASVSIATFYNVYDDLRSFEPATAGPFPFVITNKMKGEAYGVETWGSYLLLDWWRVSAGYNYFVKNISFKPGSRDNNKNAAGNDPKHQVFARSAMNLPCDLELDLALRWIHHLPTPDVPSYVALDARLGWMFRKGMEVSVSAFNLTDEGHLEFQTAAVRNELPRTFYLKLLWSF
jgi:iron complex outermembrane receptor protein